MRDYRAKNKDRLSAIRAAKNMTDEDFEKRCFELVEIGKLLNKKLTIICE
jgi:hypothetical protein